MLYINLTRIKALSKKYKEINIRAILFCEFIYLNNHVYLLTTHSQTNNKTANVL